MEYIIELHNVNKQFGKDQVLRDISVSFEEGKIYGLIGRNGSGKTVMLKCICGFVPPSSGEVWVRGKVIGRDEQIPHGIGGIIESPGFLPNYSALSNLKYLASIRNMVKTDAIRDSIRELGLNPDSKKRVGKYSLGMKQRLGIAQAIMEDPDILILDEPMNGLDNSGVRHVRELLKTLRSRGKTILLASHNSLDIDELCDCVYEMDAGALSQIR